MPDREPLLDVAAALADGTDVDWKSAAEGISNDEDRRLLAELRFLAGLTRIRPGDSSGVVTSDPSGSGSEAATASLETCDSSGDSWGPLKIIEHVGRGTFGDVYRAWDSRLDREVALKILRRREREDQTHASTVIHEGRLLARVRHPNVVTVYGAERVGGQVGVWMEFIHGKTLEQELRDQGPFDVDRAARIGIELAGALSTVHRAGLIHRDVKAQNVLCDRDGRLVLTDFGAGCELQDTAEGGTRELAGTPVSIAPEVLAGQGATAQTDVYSLGVLLYHLVTGAYPVNGRSLKEIRDAHAHGTRTPLAAARPDLPAAFVRIVDRALDPDPDNRYDSPDALGGELMSLVTPVVDEHAMAAAGGRRRWTYFAMAAILAVAGVGSVPFWWPSRVPTIAVLPFKNLSTDPNNGYFADGLTDEIIRNLSDIEGLEVRSATSSFTFKDTRGTITDIGRQLRAQLLLDGSVLWSDGRLRINVRFVRAADDATLWSLGFDREQKDVFAVQDEISRAIVNELRLKLGRGQRRYNTNLEAYALYLRARALTGPHNRSIDSARQVTRLFEQVTALDPAFAPAYAGIAEGWATMSINYSGAEADEANARMRLAADKAMQLDPLLAEAHAARGAVLARDRDWTGSEAAFRRALALNPNLTSIRTGFVRSTLFPQGKIDEAVRVLQAALTDNPLAFEVRRELAWVLVSAGRYDEAIDNARRVLAVDPNHAHTRQVMARALFHKGQTAEAIRIFEALGMGSHNFRGYGYGVTGRRAEAEAVAIQRKDLPAAQVMIQAGLGDKDRTFEALERMAAGKDPRVGIYLTYPELAFLRADPRMSAFRRKLGLPG